ncbi:MAG: hypothetical protein GX456_03690 [Verrucomicrobia bacterium]|nr:hypothetical protein [Verrucomicrobiota bacterium]
MDQPIAAQSSAFTRNTASPLNSAHVRFHETVPPKGGTLNLREHGIAQGVDNPSLPESRVYAEHSQSAEQCSCLVP